MTGIPRWARHIISPTGMLAVAGILGVLGSVWASIEQERAEEKISMLQDAIALKQDEINEKQDVIAKKNEQNLEISRRNEELARQLHDYVSGGDGFPVISLDAETSMEDESRSYFRVRVHNMGSIPLYDTKVQIPVPQGKYPETIIDFPTIPPGTIHTNRKIEIPVPESGSGYWIVDIYTRNGVFLQLYAVKLVEDEWKYATAVLEIASRISEVDDLPFAVVFEERQDGFPEEEFLVLAKRMLLQLAANRMDQPSQPVSVLK